MPGGCGRVRPASVCRVSGVCRQRVCLELTVGWGGGACVFVLAAASPPFLPFTGSCSHFPNLAPFTQTKNCNFPFLPLAHPEGRLGPFPPFLPMASSKPQGGVGGEEEIKRGKKSLPWQPKYL